MCDPAIKTVPIVSVAMETSCFVGLQVDVYCFLFTDLFLVTKLVSKKGGDKLKIVKPPMRLDKLVIQSLRDACEWLTLLFPPLLGGGNILRTF